MIFSMPILMNEATMVEIYNHREVYNYFEAHGTHYQAGGYQALGAVVAA